MLSLINENLNGAVPGAYYDHISLKGDKDLSTKVQCIRIALRGNKDLSKEVCHL